MLIESSTQLIQLERQSDESSRFPQPSDSRSRVIDFPPDPESCGQRGMYNSADPRQLHAAQLLQHPDSPDPGF